MVQWSAAPDQFMALQHFSQERALHPALVRQIEEHAGEKLLDYGCGDGRILERLSSRWLIDAYDPSPDMRRIAEIRIGRRLQRLAADPAELQALYDVIILGMVIMCIPDADDVRRVIGDCASRMSDESVLFITTTHPCFRSWKFSNFDTSFATESFSYMQDGLPFDVNLRDPDAQVVTFQDYHWSLGFTVELMRSKKLYIESMIEVPDDPDSPVRNAFVPPFLILKCRRFS